MVSNFKGLRKLIAKEAIAYVIQALKKLMNNAAAPALSRNWASVAASAPAKAPTPAAAPARNQPLTRPGPRAQAPPQARPQAPP